MMDASTLQSQCDTLLIVDDEPLMTDLFRQYMSRQGFRVLTASSAGEALAHVAVEGSAIRLVITDMTMPDMDGIRLAEALCAERPDVPVLIATGHDTEEASENLPSNVVDVVKKPYQNRLLAERIRQILELHQPRDQQS